MELKADGRPNGAGGICGRGPLEKISTVRRGAMFRNGARPPAFFISRIGSDHFSTFFHREAPAHFPRAGMGPVNVYKVQEGAFRGVGAENYRNGPGGGLTGRLRVRRGIFGIPETDRRTGRG